MKPQNNPSTNVRAGVLVTISVLMFLASGAVLVCSLVEARAITASSRRVEAASERLQQSSASGDAEQRRRNAAGAFDRAKTIAGSDEKLSRLLLLNAVNQDPSNPEYLTAYAEAVLSAGDVTPADLERARNVVELAVYQQPAERVESTLNLLDRLSETFQKSLGGRPATRTASPAATIPTHGRDYGDEFSKLKVVDSATWTDANKIAAHVESLRALATDLADDDEAGPDDAALQTQLQAELDRWSSIQRIKARCDYVDACLRKLDSGSVDLASDTAVSILQAADNALLQFWGEDFTGLPRPLTDKITAYPARISSLSATVAAARSRPVLDQMKTASASALASAAECDKQEEACRILERQIKEINNLYPRITAPAGRAEADGIIEALANATRDHRKAQYNAYQKWALDKCEVAFKHWDHLHVYTSATNAKEIYDQDKLYEVDPGLLSPEVGRLHGDVLNKLFPNMDPPVQVEMWRKTQQQKWGLDKF
ncbi:MAG TPA: hypothetical protein VK797_03260 [Tepidisphaeraceae bacterium]|jgi:hypothetical protein|nr:hypothetical protein [Tepidisphaeraceae bacterium]